VQPGYLGQQLIHGWIAGSQGKEGAEVVVKPEPPADRQAHLGRF
jgi:hypothetical protein